MSELITWIEPDGTQHPFDGDGTVGIHYVIGRQGAKAPPYSEVEQQVFDVPGSWLRNIVVGPRDLALPIVIKGSSRADLWDRERDFGRWTDPRKGNGTLRIQGPDGTSRDLVCHKIDGDRGDESEDAAGVVSQKYVVVFHANDPYLHDTDFTLRSFTTAGPVNFFDSPFLPLKLSADGVLSDFTATNQGDIECWPRWDIYGPGDNPTLTNNTTGEAMALTISLAAGQVLSIDTAPFVKTVTREDASNQYSALSLASSLWDLQVGDNSISISMTGTTTDSRIQLRYKQAYNMV